MLISNVCKSLGFEDGKKLQIQISDDNCKTWRFVCYTDDADSAFFYPHAAVDEKNKFDLCCLRKRGLSLREQIYV